MFDPYSEWLGLSKSQRPVSLYDLLGVSSTENDNETIADAATLRILQLSQHKKGPNAKAYTQLVKEIQEAREILINSARRQNYDSNPQNFKSSIPAAPAIAEDAPVDLTDENTSSPKAWWEEGVPASQSVVTHAPAAPKTNWWKGDGLAARLA
jgi:hypothetical protein